MDGKSKLKSHLQHTMLKTLVSVFGFKEFFQTHIKLLKVPQNWDFDLLVLLNQRDNFI